MKQEMKQKLSQLAAEVKAFSETYKAELAAVPYSGTGGSTCAEDIGHAIDSLDDALFEINHEAEDEEHANYSRENYRSYERENSAKERR